MIVQFLILFGAILGITSFACCVCLLLRVEDLERKINHRTVLGEE